MECSVAKCKTKARTRGLCSLHYQRSLRGQPLDAPKHSRRRPIQGVGKWTVRAKDGYVARIVKRNGKITSELQHRVVMEENLGRKLLPGENVHHINGDRADNRIENLELWLVKQPKGQRVEDLVAWAKEILARYN